MPADLSTDISSRVVDVIMLRRCRRQRPYAAALIFYAYDACHEHYFYAMIDMICCCHTLFLRYAALRRMTPPAAQRLR